MTAMSVNDKWGAFIWTLQNQISFRSSETNRWPFGGGKVLITNVIVGSLGNYPPLTDVADTGPNLDWALNTYPGDNQGDEGNYQVDLTTFYQLAIPEIAVTPKEAVTAVGGGAVQFTATGTNIPSGVTWSISPSGVTSGAVIQTAGNTADVTPGTIPNIYQIRATSVDCPNLYDEAKLTVVNVALEFQNAKMAFGKVVDPLKPPKDVRIGVIQGDTIKFKAKLMPDNVQLQNSDYVWTGIQNGNSPEIDIVFNTVGTYSEQLQVLNSQSRAASTTVINVTGPGQAAWMVLHPQYWISAPILKDEAETWASNNATTLGGGLHNGRADAARHAYWSAIMTVDWNAADAEGFATAHEKTGLDGGNPHNETVMDIENNADGRDIGAGESTELEELQNDVINTLNAGALTILDDLGNANEVGLLQPSNQ